MGIKELLSDLFSAKEKPVPKIENSVPRHNFSDAASGVKTLRKEGVDLLFLGDGKHDNKHVSNASRSIAASDLPDLHFIEESRSSQPYFDKNHTANSKTKLYCADLEEKKKAPQVKAAIEALGLYHFLKELPAYQIQPKEIKVEDKTAKTEKDQLLRQLTILRNSSGELAALNFQIEMTNNVSEALEKFNKTGRTSPQNEKDVAKFIATKIEEFHEKHGHMPTCIIDYGAGHLSNNNGLDERVVQELGKKGLHANAASIAIRPTENPSKALLFTGRTADGANFDYQLNVKQEPGRSDQLGQSTLLVGPAYLLQHLNGDMSMNALITAYNKIDDVAVTFPGLPNKDQPNIKKVDPRQTVRDYLSDESIEKTRKLGESLFKDAAEGKFDENTKKGRNIVKFLDATFEDLRQYVQKQEPIVDNAAKSRHK